MLSRLCGAAIAAMRPTFRLLRSVILLSAALIGVDAARAARQEGNSELKGEALILVGLPGDAEHEELFADTVKQWRGWLTGTLGFRPANVHVLFGKGTKNDLAQGPATRQAIEKEAARLRESLRADDRLWVFCLGHANFDGEHAWFHLPGPDLRDDEFGKLFAGLACRQQVFWMTTSESGRFVKPLSAKGRIVIAATRASGEDNETEFPHAFSAAAARPLQALDVNNDGKLSLLELYYRIVAEVQERYAVDNRVSTEHAQLDDNGDGVGAERPLVTEPGKKIGPGDDGILSLQTVLPYRSSPPKEAPLKPSTNPNPKL
jgi:hypothetical protein